MQSRTTDSKRARIRRSGLGLLLLIWLPACASEPGPADLVPEQLFLDLSGTVVVVDATGREHLFASGLATIHVHDRWGVSAQQVPVQAGRLSLRIPKGSQIELHELILDGKPAHQAALPIIIAPDNTIQLRGRWN